MHMIISTYGEKELNKIQNVFIIETLIKLGIQRNFPKSDQGHL